MWNLHPRIPCLTLPGMLLHLWLPWFPRLTLQGPSVPQGDTAHENRKTEGSTHCPTPSGRSTDVLALKHKSHFPSQFPCTRHTPSPMNCSSSFVPCPMV